MPLSFNVSFINCKACIVDWMANQVIATMATEITTFQSNVSFGCHQISGNANGPTESRAMISTEVRKYHGGSFAVAVCRPEPSRNSPQCLHLIASS